MEMDRVYRVYNEKQLGEAIEEIISIANDPKKTILIDNQDEITNEDNEPAIINRYPKIRIFEDDEWESDVIYDVDSNKLYVGISNKTYDCLNIEYKDVANTILKDARQKVFDMTSNRTNK